MQILGVIPSRYASSRLPGKPLSVINGTTLIERVYRNCIQSKLISRLVIATDDERIKNAGKQFGAEIIMTSSAIQTGSERVASVLDILSKEEETNFDIIVNIQGDMPFLEGEVIDGAIQMLIDDISAFSMTTIAIPIDSLDTYNSSSAVKVVFDTFKRALYFSRSPIPYYRDQNCIDDCIDKPIGYQHLGLYAFLPKTIKTLMHLPPTPLELAENLEQLRILESGNSIGVYLPNNFPKIMSIEINTIEDLHLAQKHLSLFDK
jgi:3-deoxy-manno-octulosonate cytidylyltransferase (CMP-KDO synthetase)